MKKITIILAAAIFITACKNNTKGNEPANTAAEKVVAAPQSAAKSQSSQGTYTTSNTSEAKKKKGMSKAAKGTIIGGTAGAVTVGLLTHSGKGAVIGGIVGAGAGYYIGRKKDKKDGRVQ